jgi:hypothetical protein
MSTASGGVADHGPHPRGLEDIDIAARLVAGQLELAQMSRKGATADLLSRDDHFEAVVSQNLGSSDAHPRQQTVLKTAGEQSHATPEGWRRGHDIPERLMG